MKKQNLNLHFFYGNVGAAPFFFLLLFIYIKINRINNLPSPPTKECFRRELHLLNPKKNLFYPIFSPRYFIFLIHDHEFLLTIANDNSINCILLFSTLFVFFIYV